MDIPFTIDEFLDVFRRYNEAVWPAQWILVILAVTAVGAALRGHARTPMLILSFLWLWIGIVYHFAFFRSINPGAVVFGALFVVQAGLLGWLAFRTPSTRFSVRGDVASVLGGLMIVFSLIIYPSLGLLAGHRYPAAPTFGLPCPTTLFTLGLLVWAIPTLPRRVFVIPVLWALIGASAALQLGMWEDLSLPLVAVITTALVIKREKPVQRFRAA